MKMSCFIIETSVNSVVYRKLFGVNIFQKCEDSSVKMAKIQRLPSFALRIISPEHFSDLKKSFLKITCFLATFSIEVRTIINVQCWLNGHK